MSDIKKSSLKKLQSLGLISANYNTETMTAGQKSWFTNRANKFSDLLKNPSNYKTPKISDKNKSAFKNSGFEVSKTNRLIVPLRGYVKVKVKNDTVFYDGVNIKTGKRVTELVRVSDKNNFEKNLKSLIDTPLKRGQTVSVKIGSNSPFNIAHTSYADLTYYLKNVFSPEVKKGKKKTKENLIAQMSLVTIEGQRNSKNKTFNNKVKKMNNKQLMINHINKVFDSVNDKLNNVRQAREAAIISTARKFNVTEASINYAFDDLISSTPNEKNTRKNQTRR